MEHDPTLEELKVFFETRSAESGKSVTELLSELIPPLREIKYAPTFHEDGTVTFFDMHRKVFRQADAADIDSVSFAALSQRDRDRIREIRKPSTEMEVLASGEQWGPIAFDDSWGEITDDTAELLSAKIRGAFQSRCEGSRIHARWNMARSEVTGMGGQHLTDREGRPILDRLRDDTIWKVLQMWLWSEIATRDGSPIPVQGHAVRRRES